MNTAPTTGAQWRALGETTTSTCPHIPAWEVHEHGRFPMAILTTSTILVKHTVAIVDGKKRLVRGHRRVAVGLS